ncbi:hypothetical protein [Thiobacillus denitrificans]|uniref:hypothetical protein n=1 Tax=Thiobacillus denitrificans TaxID=36861 RepID=UPI000363270A|nr:hypothetical protein [Thiobacillus denitrificans]
MPDSCCPFCGLVCDDIRVATDATGARAESPACARAVRLFPVPARGTARIAGQAAEPAAAYRAAAALLKRAQRPLIGGLACDVTGHRAALALAERTGGVVDHMNGAAQFRNWLAYQDGGWMTTTLSEVRNRADLIVLAGTDTCRFPRFFERCLAQESQFGELRRRLVVLGSGLSPEAAHSVSPDLAIPLQNARLGELCGALRARLAGRRLAADSVAGVPMDQVDALLEMLRAARYGVLVWNAAELTFPHADLAIQAMVDLVKDLNQTTRWSGLPLGGNDGDTSAAQVCTWQAGYPLRTAFEASGPHYQPLLFDTARLLETREVDALLWIAALDPERVPPAVACPRIVLGRPDMVFADPPDVFIPVAVPGVHHAGFMHRMDGVVALPLQGHTPTELPSVAQALAAIQQEMNHVAT